MLGYIFSGMVIISLVYSFFNGSYVQTVESGLNAVNDSLSLMFTLIAAMGFFNGFVNIAEAGGLTEKISKCIEKILKPLFPKINDNSVFGAMSMNITANLLGMGNAATPLGIKAMEKLKRISSEGIIASNAMCLFAIMNTASLQLIPSTIIAIRIKFGSIMPYSVVIPILISSISGLAAGIISAKICERKEKKWHI